MSIFAPSNRIWLKNVSITNKSQNLKFKLRNSLFSADLNSPDVTMKINVNIEQRNFYNFISTFLIVYLIPPDFVNNYGKKIILQQIFLIPFNIRLFSNFTFMRMF